MGHSIVLAIQAYGALGAVVAAWFLLLRIEADPMAQGAYAFRPLLLPGLVLLWPLVLWRVMTPPAPPREFRATHRRVWLALSVILPLLVLGAMAIRQNGPSEAAPVRLSSP